MSNETPNPYSPSVTAPMQDPFAAFDPRASRFNRCIAAMVDGFLMMFIIFPVQIATGHLRRVMTQQATPLELFLMGTVLGVTVFLVLNGLLLAKRGQTIGKWVMGLRIVDAHTQELVSFVRAYGLRYLWSLPLFIPCVFIPGTIDDTLAMFVVLFDIGLILGPARKCLHDRIAGTMVVNT